MFLQKTSNVGFKAHNLILVGHAPFDEPGQPKQECKQKETFGVTDGKQARGIMFLQLDTGAYGGGGLSTTAWYACW